VEREEETAMSAEPLRWGPLCLAGLAAGLVHVATGVVLYVSGVYFQPWSVPVMVVLLAACIASGNWWYGTHVMMGQTSYGRALLVGAVISVSSGLIYAAYNVVSISFVYPRFLEDMVQASFARDSIGLDPAAAAQLLDSLRAQLTLRNVAIGNLTAVCSLGIVLSLLISLGFLGKRTRAPRVAAEGA
jgi:hypothetical protein